MLTISKPFKGAGQGDYYLNLAREDYYLSGGEPPGRWLGRGAAGLSVSGTVEAEAFRNLLRGFMRIPMNSDTQSEIVGH